MLLWLFCLANLHAQTQAMIQPVSHIDDYTGLVELHPLTYVNFWRNDDRQE